MDTLSLNLPMVLLADREDVDAAYVVHPECAQPVLDLVNGELGYERLYVYGPTGPGTCLSNDCPHA